MRALWCLLKYSLKEPAVKLRPAVVDESVPTPQNQASSTTR